jgi:adenosylmethionine-8-amino-7-oxononanoate aminotransferase
VHIIADEIATGLGRTGTFFGCEQAHMWPDFLCLSKGITGGYLPLSVVLTRHTIYDAFYSDDLAQGFLHSHSYSGNALACTAALATLSIFEEDRVIETNRLKGQRFSRLMEPLARHPSVKNFRCCGMIWAFDVPSAQANFARQFFKAALSRELLLRPIGKTVYVMPPYVISEADIAFLVEGIGQILDDYDANKNTGAALVG